MIRARKGDWYPREIRTLCSDWYQHRWKGIERRKRGQNQRRGEKGKTAKQRVESGGDGEGRGDVATCFMKNAQEFRSVMT